MDVVSTISALGGLASLEQLRDRGFDRADVLDARRAGKAFRVRRGWYAVPGADERAIQAVRIRGQLTCVSAARALGLWAMDDGRLHVALPGNGGRLNPRVDGAPPAHLDPAVCVHWRATTVPGDARQPLRDILLHVVACQPPELALAVLDSAVREGRCTLTGLQRLLQVSERGRVLADHIDPGAGSGGESIFRWKMRSSGIRIESQFRVGRLGPRDFLVGDRLIVEIDGREHHAQVAGFTRDRRLDRELQAHGYDVIRFTSMEVTGEWDRVFNTVMRFVRCDRHRSRSVS